jgi:hypothetical protein
MLFSDVLQERFPTVHELDHKLLLECLHPVAVWWPSLAEGAAAVVVVEEEEEEENFQ